MRLKFRSLLRFLVILLLVPSLAICQVAPQPLDKHARKIQRVLAGFPAGTTIFVEMRDHSQRLGSLGAVSATSFELLSRKGDTQQFAYADVGRVQKADSDQGNTVIFHHHNKMVVSLILGGALVGFIIFAVVEVKKS
jgi:hypothetical protein